MLINRRYHSQALILAAYQCIAEYGFEGLRIRQIAAQAGIHPATLYHLYHYFPTKESLIQRVVEYATGRLATMTLVTEGTPAEELHFHLMLLFQRMLDEATLFVVLTEIGLRAQRIPEVAQTIQQQEAIWHAELVRILHAGIQQGMWPKELDTEVVAFTMIAFLEGLSTRAAYEPRRTERALNQAQVFDFTKPK